MHFFRFIPLSLLFSGLVLTTQAAHAHGLQPEIRQHSSASSRQTAFGMAGQRTQTIRTIDIRMDDEMSFTPDRIDIRQGETIRFVIHNAGNLMHEMLIGTETSLKQHAEQMAQNPHMAHQDASMAHVMPGLRGEIIWKFNRPGTFSFACLVEEHDQMGMTGIISVQASKHNDNLTPRS